VARQADEDLNMDLVEGAQMLADLRASKEDGAQAPIVLRQAPTEGALPVFSWVAGDDPPTALTTPTR
jgi:hypothetical protein